MKQHSIGKEAAIELHDSEWWKDKTHQEIAAFQLFTAELTCPFDVFQEAVEKTLGRPVWTHEFGSNYAGLCAEFLGKKQMPNLAEIMDLIPEDKRFIVTMEDG